MPAACPVWYHRPRVFRGVFGLLALMAIGACGDDLTLPSGPPGTVAVTGGGDGSGAIRSQGDLDPAIDCVVTAGVAAGDGCTGAYPAGTRVVLVAEAAAGSRFLGWAGACAGTGDCVVSVNDGPPVTATFTTGVPNLTVVGAGTGTGAGTVASQAGVTPAIECAVTGGTTCPAGCTATYPAGTTVTLVATPSPGSIFLGWGGACSGTGACTVSTDVPRIVAASFSPAPTTPRPGPDLAFSTNRSGNWDIWVANADGSGQRALIASSRDELHAAWSPDGTRIAFDREVSNGNTEIFVADADGANERRLTDRSGEDSDPSWSPDGTRLVFSRTERDDDDEEPDLYVMNVDGSGLRRLTTQSGEDFHPSWSPDGTLIAFEGERDGNYDIYVIPAAGGTPTRLTTASGDDGYPTWSPDGRQIAFTKQTGSTWDLWVMNSDGTGQRRVTTDAAEDFDPDWSRDGQGIAYTSRPPGTNFDVFIIAPSGGTPLNRSAASSMERYPSWRRR